MKIPFIIIGAVILVTAGLLLIWKPGQHQNMYPNNTTSSSDKSDEAPDFHLQDYNGKTVTLADFAGKPIVINSWAVWCPFCRQELPDLAAAQKKFADKVVIIAINRAESLGVAKGYTDQQGTTDNLIFLLDPSDSFYQSIGGFSMPETLFVDQNGAIVEHKRGMMDLKEIREKIQKIITIDAHTNGSPQSSSDAGSQDEHVVTYREGFSPSILHINIGTTVVFRSEASKPMWVASNPHPVHTDYSDFDAKRGYAKSERYSFTFLKQGTWKYHNHLNSGESGVIVVE